ncbi:uncharacterized protein LOC131008148 [Salvia miltiorrhiza]|uniref:uncharacterized protein LOC131008148 n=1 Tax=Salvia miltiorrhiza TaxID=226208 RepID=UPI0025ABF313|nr:uncharacterized protein LOC131008148 [Salvia miltiorrhiza]
MASSRQPNYTIDEDKHLCLVYLEISQDSKTGIHQRKENFWDHVREVYNEEKLNPNMYTRSSRSLKTRMQFTRAKELMMLDTKYKKVFKFEHVWSIMKDYQKIDCPSQNSRQQMSASQSDSLPQSPISPDGLSNFSINLSDGSGSGSGSSHRPDGVKKTKNKRKKGNFHDFGGSGSDIGGSGSDVGGSGSDLRPY